MAVSSASFAFGLVIIIMLKRITVKVMAEFIPELMGISGPKKGHSLYDRIKVGFIKKV